MRHLAKEQTHAQIDPEKGFKIHLLVFVLTIPALWLLWFFTDSTYLWPVWQTEAWGIGIVFHYLAVFVFRKNYH